MMLDSIQNCKLKVSQRCQYAFRVGNVKTDEGRKEEVKRAVVSWARNEDAG